MNCSCCSEEMEWGYIQCRDGVVWDSKKSMVAALPSIRENAIVLGSGGGPFSGAAVPAYHCKRCKKIVIEYE